LPYKKKSLGVVQLEGLGHTGKTTGGEQLLSNAKSLAESEQADRPRSRRKTLSREAWIAAALKVLERGGIADVKIDVLAKRLKVTRGSFYFHFSGLKDLQEGLLEDWRTRNCRPFQALSHAQHADGLAAFDSIVNIWVDEDPFRPLLDMAVRDWSRTSRKLSDEMESIDNLRISLLARAFRAMEYTDDESVVRARITYFHQIGYYALSFKEPATERKRYQPLYGDILLGPRGARTDRTPPST
jgi:AcrR family transcriptional regulator